MGERNDEIMAIPYSLVMRSAKPAKPELGNKTYAMAQYARVIDLPTLAAHMSMHDSKYNRGDVMAVLMQMVDCVREELLLGNRVVLGDLGTFSVSLHSTGVADADSFNASMIRSVRVRWSPSSLLGNLRQEAQFTFVGTRQSQNEARRAERLRLNGMASAGDDATGPDVTPGGGEDVGE